MRTNLNGTFFRASLTLAAVAALSTQACGSDFDAAEPYVVGDGGTSAGHGGSGGSSGSKSKGPASGGSGGTGVEAGDGGEAGAVSGEAGAGGEGAGGDSGGETCVPSGGVDVPDDQFADTDCDGIDGNANSAVFVSPNGSDDAAGTREEPVLTIGKALELAAEGGLSVYVCNGTYEEAVRLTTGATIVGGYDCTNGWRRDRNQAIVEPASGIPLKVIGVDAKVYIERIAFRAPDGSTPGQSSQAASIVDSSDVSLYRVELSAGNGANAAHAVKGTDASQTLPPKGSKGADTSTVPCNYGDGGVCAFYAVGGGSSLATTTCEDVDGQTITFRASLGGRGANIYTAGYRAPSCASMTGGNPALPQLRVGSGLWVDIGGSQYGASGSPGSDGAPASSGFGSVEGGRYQATNVGSDGTRGAPGKPGLGGAGGMSYASGSGGLCGQFYPGSGGGQGGLPGCGGGGAKGAGAGGGSIGLVIQNSSVVLDSVVINTRNGGRGGDGASGGLGQLGGQGGDGGLASTASTSLAGKPGSAGGAGGRGGDGGPGGGGPSIGIIYMGTAPALGHVVFGVGAPGSGGKPVSGAAAPAGIKAEIYEVK